MKLTRKVTVISPVHEVNDIRVYKKEALSLCNAGYQVSIIAKESAQKIDINPDINVIELSYKNRLFRFLNIPRIIFLALKENADIYHIHNPDTLPVGFFLKFFRKKVVYDTHENFYKKIHVRAWIPKPIRTMIASFIFHSEVIGSKFFNATILTQEEQLKDYTRSHLIGNAPIANVMQRSTQKRSLPVDKIKLVFIGGISIDRGLMHMIKLCQEMNDKTPTELYLIGPAINAMTQFELSDIVNQYDNIFYKGSIAQESAFEIAKNCDYGLIIFDDVADYSDISPNKLFEYMMLGTPFVATSFPKWVDFLKKEEAGFFVLPNKIDSSFANELIQFRSDLSRYSKMVDSGIDFINNTYNWNIVDEPKLLDLYCKVLGE